MSNRVDFLKLLISSFVSQTGSYFLTISIAASILGTTGSTVKASLIFVLAYLPSIFVSSKIGTLIDRKLSRNFLIAIELISIGLTVLCGLALRYDLALWILAALVSIRSITMATTRTGLLTWLKQITVIDQQKERNKIFNLCFFLSTAVAGVLASTILEAFSIEVVVVVDIATYLLSILVLSLLPSDCGSRKSQKDDRSFTLSSTIRSILRVPALRKTFILVMFSQTVFQGAYTVLVAYLPIQHFDRGIGNIGFFQLAASLGITFGFLILWRVPKLFKTSNIITRREIVTGILASVSLFVCIETESLILSVLTFGLLNFFYECLWLHNISEYFHEIPRSQTARYQYVLQSVASFSMALFALMYSVLIESSNLLSATLIVLGVALLFVVMTHLFSPPMPILNSEGEAHYE